MNQNIFIKLILLTNFIFLSVSCVRSHSPKTNNYKNIQGPVAKLISTRPENSGPLKIIIKLPADPLAKVPKEEWSDQLNLIQDQQKKLISQLNAISSEIKIIYTYKTILNGMFVVIPESEASKVDAVIPEGSHIELSTLIQRPDAIVELSSNSSHGDLSARNSVKFIGADQIHAQGIKGQGIKVGIIDTGIDYTHSMLGGSGSVDDYKKVIPNQASPFFPNNKVVGGYDFVGTEYDSASPNPLLRIPIPDANPIDESGHGSHVAGTVAGISNGPESYDGVAPEAQLYALKVFGKDGSTDDAIVIAALEFAADPDNDIVTKNPLDVVNLSLGSPYGSPKLLYKEAISNLNSLGTLVVASAGNSGDVSYITGSPAVSDEALSVAASIDDMEHNWHFATSAFKIADENDIITEIAEATFTKPLEFIEHISGKLVYVGLAKEITEEQASQLKGNMALIDRGEINFSIKIKNAFNAGATAAVVVNNREGSPSAMSGDADEDDKNKKLDIPAVMISQTPGKSIREAVQKGIIVIANLKIDTKVAKPELIDSLTDFSSRGPRSEDSIIKPEIAAPGSNIISAKVGGGNEIVTMSGTSMAAPHMTGVMALLKQTHPTLTPQELKSLSMLTAKSINNTKGAIYPIALQGAGRVQIPAANTSSITMTPAALSLGRHEVVASKTISRKIKIKNLEAKDLTLNLDPKFNANLALLSPKTISLKANEESLIDFQIKITAPNSKTFDNELDGFLLLIDQNKKTYSIPILAMALKISQVTSSALKVHSSSEADSTGSLSELTLNNHSLHSGPAYLFNLLGMDGLKDDHGINKRGLTTACDLESVGFRTVFVENKGQKTELLQMALKLYNPLTAWSNCEFSVQIDSNNDGIADQELAGANLSNTEGLGAGMASILLDANKARALRKEYESKLTEKNPKKKPILSFANAVEALMDVTIVNQSTLMIIQAPVAGLKAIPGQNLRVKVGALNIESDTIEGNDFLGQNWLDMPLNAQAQTLTDIPESLLVAGNGEINIQLTIGEGQHPLILYYPNNHASMTSVSDQQSQVLQMEFVDKK